MGPLAIVADKLLSGIRDVGAQRGEEVQCGIGMIALIRAHLIQYPWSGFSAK